MIGGEIAHVSCEPRQGGTALLEDGDRAPLSHICQKDRLPADAKRERFRGHECHPVPGFGAGAHHGVEVGFPAVHARDAREVEK